jgi:CMP-N,N'-diacetyllegionaminic acid synthase
MKICFDIDGVLCSQVERDYREAQPNQQMIALVNRLYDRGNQILLYTSRFMGRAKGDTQEAERIGRDFTERQLADWGVRYHELSMGKPRYDFVIDDRSVFYDPDCSRIEAFLEERAVASAK